MFKNWSNLIVVVLLGTSQTLLADPEPYWTPTGTGIEGVGAITKTWPEDTSDLHWNAGTGPEYADFDVTIVNPEDCDTYHWYVDGYWYSRTSNRNTSWLVWWVASAGEMDLSGYYTPPDTIDNAVTIECFVYDCSAEYLEASMDEPDPAYYDDGDDPPVHRTWTETLSVFKVGVYMSADNCYYWEDDPATDKGFLLKSDLSELECSRMTELVSMTDLQTASTGWDIERTWQTVTMPTNCAVQGGISYGPFFYANGILEIWLTGYCSPPSTLSTIAALVQGVAGIFPLGNYQPAAASVTYAFGDGNCDVAAAISIKSVIQYVGTGELTYTEGPWSNAILFLGFMGAVT